MRFATVTAAEEYARTVLFGSVEAWREGWENGDCPDDVHVAVSDAQADAHRIGETLGGVAPDRERAFFYRVEAALYTLVSERCTAKGWKRGEP